MKKDILILKNIPREGPGLIEDVLNENNIRYKIFEIDRIHDIHSVNEYGALIVLGGPASANNADQNMKKELELIRTAINSKIPYLGICLGLQTMVKAMGGQVVKCQINEVGFRNKNGERYNIKLTPQGMSDSFFKDLPDSLNVFQLHGETVKLSPHMSLLASGDSCKNQIVKLGDNAYGIQCHFELTREMLDLWIKYDQDLKQMSRAYLLEEFDSIKDDYLKTGRQLIMNFFRIANYIT
jgi:GMP synthase-like glutamine amidotransferase